MSALKDRSNLSQQRPLHIHGCMSAVLGLLFLMQPMTAIAAEITLTPISNFAHGAEAACEIAAFDAANRRLLVINGEQCALDMLDIGNPRLPSLWKRVELKKYGEVVTSVAVADHCIAVAICRAKGERGNVLLLDHDGQLIDVVSVGYHPDMVTFTPAGDQLLVANEGEPNDDYTIDPPGSISIVRRVPDGSWKHHDLDFKAWNDKSFSGSVRIFGPHSNAATDLEPEYIAVSPNGERAWVTLQENNAVAILDLREPASIMDIVGLGFKDHSQIGNGLDASDIDHEVHIDCQPIWSVYQPDAIACFTHQGTQFLITANEGDVRDCEGFHEATTVAELELDPRSFPEAKELQKLDHAGHLQVTRTMGDDDHDGRYEKLFALGGRSFAIWDASMKMIYDSGDLLERVSAERFPSAFNSNNSAATFDLRSSVRGPEPEGVTVGIIDGRTIAFLGLERPSAVLAVDLSQPASPAICGVYHASMAPFNLDQQLASDRGPEGICFIPAETSPNGKPLLAVCFEVSGNTRIFEIGL